MNGLPVMAILHFHYGREAIRPIVKIWPAGAFGICLFNLTAWLTIDRLGVASAIALGYAVDVAYLAGVSWPHRHRLSQRGASSSASGCARSRW